MSEQKRKKPVPSPTRQKRNVPVLAVTVHASRRDYIEKKAKWLLEENANPIGMSGLVSTMIGLLMDADPRIDWKHVIDGYTLRMKVLEAIKKVEF